MDRKANTSAEILSFGCVRSFTIYILVDSDEGVYRFFDLLFLWYFQVSGFDSGLMPHAYTACNSYIGSSSFILKATSTNIL